MGEGRLASRSIAIRRSERGLVTAAIVILFLVATTTLYSISISTSPAPAATSTRSNKSATSSSAITTATNTTLALSTSPRESSSQACKTPCPVWSQNVTGGFARLAISPDDKYVVAGTGYGGRYGTVYLFDKLGQTLWTRNFDRIILSVAVSSNGSFVAVAGSQLNLNADVLQNGSLYVFNKKGELLWDVDTGGHPMLDVRVAANGSRVIAMTNQKILYMNQNGKLLWSYGTPTGQTAALDSSTDASRVVASLAYLGNRPDVYSWSFVTFDGRGDVLWNYTAADGGEAELVAVSSNSSYVIGSSVLREENGTLYLFTKEGALLRTSHISPALSIEPGRIGSNTLVNTRRGTLVFGQQGSLLRNFTVGPAVNFRGSCDAPTFWARNPEGTVMAFLDNQGRVIATYLPQGVATRAALSQDGHYAAVAFVNRVGFHIVLLLLMPTDDGCS